MSPINQIPLGFEKRAVVTHPLIPSKLADEHTHSSHKMGFVLADRGSLVSQSSPILWDQSKPVGGGVTDEQINKMIIENPKRILTFVEAG